MNWIKQTWLGLLGLFVDDGSLAVALIAWVLAAAFLLPRILPAEWTGLVLFVGVALILIENVARSARTKRKN